MPPIPIYSNAPITAAAKPDGTTPQPATEEQLQPGSVPPPTRTTAVPTSSTNSSSPPAPQPGARPIPPTQAAQPAISAAAYGGPLPPQPGQAPSAATVPPTAAASSIPGASSVTAPPQQFNMPPPTMNAAATHSTHPSFTSMSTTSSFNANAGPTTINFGPAAPPLPSSSSQYALVSPPAAPGLSNVPTPAPPTSTASANLAHPPGYVQNPYAADGTAAQRERLVAAAEQRRLDGQSGEGTGVGAVAGSVWGSVVAAASKVGEGLKRGEEEAWRLAGGKGR